MKHFLAFLLLAVPVTLPKQLLFRADGASIGNERAIGAKLGDIISVKDPHGSTPGAVGDGVADDTAAVQAGWNTVASSGGALRFPCGTYLVSSAISVSNTFFGGSMVGDSWNCVTLKATGSMTSVILYTDGGANGRFTFRDLTIDGNSLANSGVYSHFLRNVYMERVNIKGTLVAAVDSAEGWDNDFVSCEFANNSGDGMRLGTNANSVNVTNTKILINAGWGIKITSGPGPINITGSDLESNAKGGIVIAQGAGTPTNGVLNIKNNYFEGNAAYYATATTTSGQPTVAVSAAAVAIANANIGHAYYGASIPASTTISSASGTTITLNNNATASTTETEYIAVGDTLSAINVYADILLNGSGDFASLLDTYPLQAANIEGNLATTHAATHFVAYVAGESLRIVGNVRPTYSSRTLILYGSLVNPFIPQGSITFSDNRGFTGWNGAPPEVHQRAPLLAPNGGTVVIDLSLGSEFVITPTTATAFTIANPANRFSSASRNSYQRFTIRIRDALGGGTPLGAITWGSAGAYKMYAWVNPADTFSRSITFTWDAVAVAWVEEYRTAADVPN